MRLMRKCNMWRLQISIAETDIQDKTKQLKDLQRQKYFLEQEITRRKGLIRVLQTEIDNAQMQHNVKSKLLKKVKKEVW
jgi:peptidoglycan hydrolase CwlO-like protein